MMGQDERLMMHFSAGFVRLLEMHCCAQRVKASGLSLQSGPARVSYFDSTLELLPDDVSPAPLFSTACV